MPGTHQPRPHLPAPALLLLLPSHHHHHHLPFLVLEARTSQMLLNASTFEESRVPSSTTLRTFLHVTFCSSPARADHSADDICFTAFLSWPTTYRVVSFRVLSCRVASSVSASAKCASSSNHGNSIISHLPELQHAARSKHQTILYTVVVCWPGRPRRSIIEAH